MYNASAYFKMCYACEGEFCKDGCGQVAEETIKKCDQCGCENCDPHTDDEFSDDALAHKNCKCECKGEPNSHLDEKGEIIPSSCKCECFECPDCDCSCVCDPDEETEEMVDKNGDLMYVCNSCAEPEPAEEDKAYVSDAKIIEFVLKISGKKRKQMEDEFKAYEKGLADAEKAKKEAKEKEKQGKIEVAPEQPKKKFKAKEESKAKP